jgi:hypothetical protein
MEKKDPKACLSFVLNLSRSRKRPGRVSEKGMKVLKKSESATYPAKDFPFASSSIQEGSQAVWL